MNSCVVCPVGHPVVVHPSKLGTEVACPRCLECFCAELPRPDVDFAKESGKRPLKKKRDDDDDDEKPAKKKPAKDAKTEKKKPVAKKKKDDDEDDDEEDDEDEEEDPEADINWNARKRGLKTCHSGLGLINIGNYGLIVLYLFAELGVCLAAFGAGAGMYDTGVMILMYGALPIAHIVLAIFVVGLFMNMRIPAKAEAGVGLYSALAMGLFTFFVSMVMLIARTGAFFEDPERTKNFVNLLFGAVIFTYVVTWMSMMGYYCSVLSFMKMTNDASQPITNGVFGAVPFIILIALHFGADSLRSGIGGFMGWVIIAFVNIAGDYAIYMLVLQIKLTNKLRFTIWDHIVWE